MVEIELMIRLGILDATFFTLLYPLSFILYPSLVDIHGPEITGRHVGPCFELPVKIGYVVKSGFHTNLRNRDIILNQ